jgi:primosomal protein N' (replication factor Y)
MKKIAEVLISLPVDKTFYYSIPRRLEADVKVGSRVLVPFGRQRVVGYVVAFPSDSCEKKLKDIVRCLDERPFVSPAIFKIAHFIAHHYWYPYGRVLEHMIPALLKKKRAVQETQAGEEKVIARDDKEGPVSELAEDLAPLIDFSQAPVRLVYGLLPSQRLAVYRALARAAHQRNTSAAFIFPDAESADVFYRMMSPEGGVVGLYGSLSAQERFQRWMRAHANGPCTVIGTKNVLCVPFSQCGIICVDGIHQAFHVLGEPFKFDMYTAARYAARLYGAAFYGFDIIPAAGVYAHKEHVPQELFFTGALSGAPAQIRVIDMREEFREVNRKSFFSRAFLYAAEKLLSAQGRIALVCTRKGFATFIVCKKCGFVVKCPRCASVMVYRQDEKVIKCPRCRARRAYVELCPHCKSGYLRYQGRGTQKIESDFSKLFPSARIKRLDHDVSPRQKQEVIACLREGALDAVVTTKSALKDVPAESVDLVALLDPDLYAWAMNFRLMEELYKTIVIARALSREGTVFIQSFHSDAYIFDFVKNNDIKGFLEKELSFRKDAMLPPYASVFSVEIKTPEAAALKKKSAKLYRLLCKDAAVKDGTVQIFEPFTGPRKEAKSYCAEMVVKSPSFAALKKFFKDNKKHFHSRGNASIMITPDIEALG